MNEPPEVFHAFRGSVTPHYASDIHSRFQTRLCRPRGLPPPCYGRGALRAWAQRLRELWGSDADAYVFFNNDGQACAPRDAARFERLVERGQPAPKMAATSWGAATANCA